MPSPPLLNPIRPASEVLTMDQKATDKHVEKTSLIGQRVRKPDAPDKSTGKTRYLHRGTGLGDYPKLGDVLARLESIVGNN